MSLTSYRAAPPRDKPLPCLRWVPEMNRGQRLLASIGQVRKLPEKATRGDAPWVRALCINAGPLWKGPNGIFSGILSGGTCNIAGKQRPTGDSNSGGDYGGFVRFHRGRRRLGRLRGRKQALGGPANDHDEIERI